MSGYLSIRSLTIGYYSNSLFLPAFKQKARHASMRPCLCRTLLRAPKSTASWLKNASTRAKSFKRPVLRAVATTCSARRQRAFNGGAPAMPISSSVARSNASSSRGDAAGRNCTGQPSIIIPTSARSVYPIFANAVSIGVSKSRPDLCCWKSSTETRISKSSVSVGWM